MPWNEPVFTQYITPIAQSAIRCVANRWDWNDVTFRKNSKIKRHISRTNENNRRTMTSM